MAEAQSNQEIPGWVLLSPGAVPEAWRARGVPMVLVPMTPSEASRLLSGVPVEQGIPASDHPLIHMVARGHSAAEIARSLGFSRRTIHRKVARLSREFGVSTIQELAAELARRGF